MLERDTPEPALQYTVLIIAYLLTSAVVIAIYLQEHVCFGKSWQHRIRRMLEFSAVTTF